MLGGGVPARGGVPRGGERRGVRVRSVRARAAARMRFRLAHAQQRLRAATCCVHPRKGHQAAARGGLW